MFAKVIADVANTNVDKTFDYIIPEGMKVFPGGRVMIPFGPRHIEGMVVGVGESSDCEPEKLKKIISPIDTEPVVSEEQLKTAAYMCAEYRTTMAICLRLMYPAQMRGSRVRERTRRFAVLEEQGGVRLLAEREKCFKKDGTPRYPKRLAALDRLAAGPVPASELGGTLKYLTEHGIARVALENDPRLPYSALNAQSSAPPKLTEQQRLAARHICADIDSAQRHTVLLHGVTGSGKTEVYMAAAAHALEAGKSAILLVPEISLTPQLYSGFASRFPGKTAVFHSRLSAGEKYDEWRRVLSGEARVVIGARSAVFLPAKDLGLIILDEEHEQSYRADSHPQYHAARIAALRAGTLGATVVLGSATPQVETYYRAKMGIYELVEMPERVRGLPLPPISVVDMRGELRRGNSTAISGELYSAMNSVLLRGEQVMLFLNRRGYSSSIQCQSCGKTIMCPHCDIPLKYHKEAGVMLCHYCGRSFPYTKTCPECGEQFLRYGGIGTQRLEEQTKKLFPGARILRMDLDTTRAKDSHLEIYNAFKNREADILIGTQMIARGLDFDGVSLAAVISADSMLGFEDYRADERTFSMIEQVGGRAGRMSRGRVIVQTLDPDNFVIGFAKDHDYKGFFSAELRRRHATAMPPFARIYRLVFSHKNAEKAEEACEDFKKRLEKALLPYAKDVLLLSGAAAPTQKLKDRFRFHIVLKIRYNRSTAGIDDVLFALWSQAGGSDVRISAQINPYDMN